LKAAAILTLALALVVLGLILFTHFKALALETAYPNKGELIDIGGQKMNALHVPAGPGADLPPLLFIHGASGNLHDPGQAFLPSLKGRAEMLFVDRPGHGYSERGGPEDAFPDGQADKIAKVMDHYGMKNAIVVAHSFGGSIAASLALQYPDRVRGLLFLSAATHPWPGGVGWYYRVAANPVFGWLFTRTISLPAGLQRMATGVDDVFLPNKTPAGYLDNGHIPLVLRPDTFRYNAEDIVNLHDYVSRISARYPEIKVPTVIITGDADRIVLADIHSRGLARDIEGSELVWVHGMGHKPDYIATDLCIAAIEKLAGQPRDLQARAREVEARIGVTRGG
jgi:pimeloyl-ACP methyl ester carboxylesterase